MSFSDLLPQNFLLMIENSTALAAFWSDLRDCYLPRLIEQLSGSQPLVLNNIFIAESRPDPQEFHTSVAKHCSSLEAGLAELQFNYDPDNRLSVTQIQAGIKLLSSTPANQSRHLIIVAATTPLELLHGYPTYDPWNELAKMLAKEEVYLHLALTADLRSGRLPDLFEQSVKWQQHTEEPLWLPKYSTALIFRVSAPKYDPAQGGSETRVEQSTRAPRALRDVIPSDIYTTKSLDDTSPESPSLVSQLQQVHGLTKKKVYGAKPARVPFILESERVRERYRKVPSQSPSSLPLPPETSAPPSLTRASRSHANLRADRSFSAQPARPVDSQPYQWQQQQQPMSSPEVDSPYSSSTLSSPPSPAVENPRFRIDSSSTRLVPEELEFYMQAFPSHEHFTDPGTSFHPDAQSSHGDMPITPPAGASSSPRFPVPPLGSPAYLPHAPGVEGYAPAMTMEPLEFQSNRFAHRPRDTDPGGYPFPSSVAALPTYMHTGHAHAHTHIHAPAPSSAATASFPANDDRDDHAAHLVLSAPAPRRVPQQSTSTSIPPPGAGPAPHHRADRAAHSHSVTAAAHPSLETRSFPPPHASARSRSSSTHAPSSSSSSSSAASSSLTGWAG